MNEEPINPIVINNMKYSYNKAYKLVWHLCTESEHKSIQNFFEMMREKTITASRRRLIETIFTKYLRPMGLKIPT